jgi:hypothetical protein
MTPTLQEALRVLEGAKLVPAVATSKMLDLLDCCEGETIVDAKALMGVLYGDLLRTAPPEYQAALDVVRAALRDAERYRKAVAFVEKRIAINNNWGDEDRADEARTCLRGISAIAASGEPK